MISAGRRSRCWPGDHVLRAAHPAHAADGIDAAARANESCGPADAGSEVAPSRPVPPGQSSVSHRRGTFVRMEWRRCSAWSRRWPGLTRPAVTAACCARRWRRRPGCGPGSTAATSPWPAGWPRWPRSRRRRWPTRPAPPTARRAGRWNATRPPPPCPRWARRWPTVRCRAATWMRSGGPCASWSRPSVRCWPGGTSGWPSWPPAPAPTSSTRRSSPRCAACKPTPGWPAWPANGEPPASATGSTVTACGAWPAGSTPRPASSSTAGSRPPWNASSPRPCPTSAPATRWRNRRSCRPTPWSR